MAGRLEGKVALISGGAGGCGLAASELFAREGAVIHAADIDEAGGTALAAELGDKVHFHRCDVSQTADIKALMDTVAATSGGIAVFLRGQWLRGTGTLMRSGWCEGQNLSPFREENTLYSTHGGIPGVPDQKGAAIPWRHHARS